MIMFLALAGVACAPFDCIDGGAGISYMRSSPDMACKINYTQSALGTGEDASTWKLIGTGYDASTWYFTYTTRLACGAIALSCCIVAIVLIAITLRCGHAKLFSDERFMGAFGSLYLRYDPEHYYWEVLVLARKLLLVLITKVLSNNPTAQIAGCAVVLGGALALQYRSKPFLSDALDALEGHTLAACVAIVVLGACSLLGMPPIAVTALYTVIMLVSAVIVARDMHAVYNEGSSRGGAGVPPVGEGGGATAKGAGAAVAPNAGAKYVC
jgi:hypothetical protein